MRYRGGPGCPADEKAIVVTQIVEYSAAGHGLAPGHRVTMRNDKVNPLVHGDALHTERLGL